MLNDKICNLTPLKTFFLESGMAKNHVEWKKVKAGEILAKGFPSDISPSPACTFGIATFKQLLQDDVVFSFQGLVTYFQYVQPEFDFQLT